MVRPGESILVAGASGSGKSTLCRASIGLVPHFHGGELIGCVWVDGLDTREHPVHELFGHVGLAFQNPDAQLFNQTVEAELAYGLESVGLAPEEIERRLIWVSEVARLRPLLDRSPHSLSGGEKQCVVLGAILALRPRLVLLDEPFTHLDPEGAERLRAILRAMRAEGIGFIVVEHRLHAIVDEVDRLVVLHRGHVVADGPSRQVLAQDLSNYGLNLPPLVLFFREQGRVETPLTVDEALLCLRKSVETQEGRYPSSYRSLDWTFPDHSLKPANPPSGFRNSVIEVNRVRFSYGDLPVLSGVNLKLNRGECVVLAGRNGGGKTTLVKHFNALLKPGSGEVKVLGRDTRSTSVSELARHVGFAWQNPNDQLFQANVREEVLTGPRVLRAYDPAWCDRLFERFGLGPLMDRSPFRLSEGEKKRVAFATALAAQPEVVILDEPTAGQDEPFRRELASLIRELRAEGRTVVLVTHDLEFAAEHADRWVVLAGGQIVADGSPQEVMGDSEAMAAAGLRPTQLFQLRKALAEWSSEEGTKPYVV